MNSQVMATQAADLLVSISQVTSIHPTLTAQLSQHPIERRAAQQLERVGRFGEAAQYWQHQANRLIEGLPAPAAESSSDEWNRALAMAHLYRAVECWILAIPQQGDEARSQAVQQATRLLSFGIVDEVLMLRIATQLLQGNDRRSVCEWLLACAQACPPASPERAILVAHAARAAEALQSDRARRAAVAAPARGSPCPTDLGAAVSTTQRCGSTARRLSSACRFGFRRGY